MSKAEPNFQETVAGLLRGDFSRLDPLFEGEDAPILRWAREGKFEDEAPALNEALTCACFNGRTAAAQELLACGADLDAGDGTGLSALHWGVNRGQFETTRWLVNQGASLERKSHYDGTVLDTAVWSLVNEPREAHEDIVRFLIEAGADVSAVQFESGNEKMDALLGRT